MTKTMYQYKLLSNVPIAQITESNLNALGNQGWKLIYLQVVGSNAYGIFIRE